MTSLREIMDTENRVETVLRSTMTPAITEPKRTCLDVDVSITADESLGAWHSFSWIITMPDDRRTHVISEARRVLRRPRDLWRGDGEHSVSIGGVADQLPDASHRGPQLDHRRGPTEVGHCWTAVTRGGTFGPAPVGVIGRRTRRGGATRSRSRCDRVGRGRATGTCPRGRPGHARRPSRCGTRRHPRARMH